MQIEFHALADKEVLKSHRRYLRRSPITATRYMAALEKAIEQIVAAPDRWPLHLFGTRFRRLHRFPYFVVYLVCLDKIRILAVPHDRRRPGYWKRRS